MSRELRVDPVSAAQMAHEFASRIQCPNQGNVGSAVGHAPVSAVESTSFQDRVINARGFAAMRRGAAKRREESMHISDTFTEEDMVVGAELWPGAIVPVQQPAEKPQFACECERRDMGECCDICGGKLEKHTPPWGILAFTFAILILCLVISLLA